MDKLQFLYYLILKATVYPQCERRRMKPHKLLKRWYYLPSHRLNVNVMLSNFFVIFEDLGFSKIRNFNDRSAVRGQYASLYRISSKSVKRLQRYGDLTVFFKMAADRHLGFIERLLGPPTMTFWWSLSLCTFSWNRCSSFDNMRLSIFCPFGLKTPIDAPKNGGFGKFHPQNGEQCQRNPQKAHTCASPRRLSHQTWKSVDGSDL